MSLAKTLAQLHERLAAAADRSGRAATDVRLVAVTKYASMDAVRAVLATGHRDLGENRPQQLLARATELESAAPTWHLIGQLQRNKARKLLPAVAMVHSADSLKLLQSLSRLAEELALRPRVLLEVNISGETAKSGFTPDELRATWPQIAALTGLDVAGLMTVAPYADEAETVRPIFRGLRRLRDEIAATGSHPLPELSMGMSGDFEVAIEEGATIVRIGSALFGA